MPMADRSGPRTLLLDALGTLVALEPPAPALRSELAQRCGLDVSEAQARHALSREISYYRAHLNEGRDAESLTALRHRCAEGRAPGGDADRGVARLAAFLGLPRRAGSHPRRASPGGERDRGQQLGRLAGGGAAAAGPRGVARRRRDL